MGNMSSCVKNKEPANNSPVSDEKIPAVSVSKVEIIVDTQTPVSLLKVTKQGVLSRVIDSLHTLTAMEETDEQGNSPLHCAVLQANFLILKELLQWLIYNHQLNSVLRLKNYHNKTVWHLACESMHANKILTMLVDACLESERRIALVSAEQNDVKIENPFWNDLKDDNSQELLSYLLAMPKMNHVSIRLMELMTRFVGSVIDSKIAETWIEKARDKKGGEDSALISRVVGDEKTSFSSTIAIAQAPRLVEAVQTLLNLFFLYQVSVGNIEEANNLLTKGANLNARTNWGLDAVLYATLYGQIKILKWLVEEKGQSLDVSDNKGNTPVMSAVLGGQLKALKWLVDEKGQSLAVRNSVGYGPVLMAAFCGHLPVLQWLVEEKGQSLDVSDNKGNTPVISAVLGGQLNALKWLVDEKGQSLAVRNRTGDNSVLMAAFCGHLPVLQWLVEEKGQSLIVINNNGHTPLLLAAERGHLAVLKWLVDEKGQSLARGIPYEFNPLLFATRGGHLHILQWLVEEKNQSLDANNGALVLIAAREGHLDVLKWLVDEKGQSLSVRNHYWLNPVLFAAYCGHLHVLQWLVEKKDQSLDVRDSRGEPPVLLAAREGHLDILKWLVDEKGQSLSVRNYCWLNPVLFAAYCGHLHVLQWLVEKKDQSLGVSDNSENTPVLLAAREGHLDVLKWLIEKECETEWEKIFATAMTYNQREVAQFVFKCGLVYLVKTEKNARLLPFVEFVLHRVPPDNYGNLIDIFLDLTEPLAELYLKDVEKATQILSRLAEKNIHLSKLKYEIAHMIAFYFPEDFQRKMIRQSLCLDLEVDPQPVNLDSKDNEEREAYIKNGETFITSIYRNAILLYGLVCSEKTSSEMNHLLLIFNNQLSGEFSVPLKEKAIKDWAPEAMHLFLWYYTKTPAANVRRKFIPADFWPECASIAFGLGGKVNV